MAATVTHRVATASTTNASTYASGSFTPAANDLLVASVVVSGQAARGGSMTDSQSLGWDLITTALKNTSADTVYVFVSRALAANSSMTVTFATNNGAASGAIVDVDSVSGMSRVGAVAVRQSAIQENQAASGTPAPVFGSAALTGNPTLGAVGNSTNAATLTPPGGTQCNGGSYTENADVGYATPTTGGEFVSCDSGFTGTTVTWGSTSASAFGDIIIELDTTATPAAPAVPTLVQWIGHPNQSNSAPSDYKLNFAQGTQSGNAAVCFFTYASTGATASATDDKSDTWTLGVQISDSTNGQTSGILIALNVASGMQKIDVHLSVAKVGFQAACAEFNNVATSSATDGSKSTGNITGPGFQAGSFNTTNNGDLILQVMCATSGTAASTPDSFTADTGFANLYPDGPDFFDSQWAVQATHGATNPKITDSRSGAVGGTATIALKPASAGGVASGLRVVGMQTINFPQYLGTPSATSWTLQFPTYGNALAIAWEGSHTVRVTAVSDSINGSWTAGTSVTGASGNDMQFFYKCNATPGATMTVTFTLFAAGTDYFAFWDMAGAATSCFDKDGTNTGNLAATSGTASGPTLTPAISGELMLGSMNEDNQQCTNVSPGTYTSSDTGAIQVTWEDQDGGTGNYLVPNTSATTRTWTFTNRTGINVATWWVAEALFKPIVASGPPPGQFPRIVGVE
jgi:hypothetical protein